MKYEWCNTDTVKYEWNLSVYILSRLANYTILFWTGGPSGTDENCNPEIDDGETYDMVCVEGAPPTEIYGNVEFLGK